MDGVSWIIFWNIKRSDRKNDLKTWKRENGTYVFHSSRFISLCPGVVESSHSSHREKRDAHNRGTLHQRRTPERNHIFCNKSARFSGHSLACATNPLFFQIQNAQSELGLLCTLRRNPANTQKNLFRFSRSLFSYADHPG